MKKVLVIGSGPVTIGQGTESDAAAVQAIQALHTQGWQTVAVNSDPATLMSDLDRSHRSYIEPLTCDVLKQIIAAERPQALFAGVGGQRALNLNYRLSSSGVLDEYKVMPIGVGGDTIYRTQHRFAFHRQMKALNINTPASIAVASEEDARAAAAQLQYPIAIRPSFTSGGNGSRIIFNAEELSDALEAAQSAGLSKEVTLQQGLSGWHEMELVLMRDAQAQVKALSIIENIEPVGIHSGNSVCVIPPMTIADSICQKAVLQARIIMNDLNIIGGATIKFAFEPETETLMALSVDPCWSRSAALTSRSSERPLAYLFALLASGQTIDTLAEETWRLPPPADNRKGPVAVKQPVWDMPPAKMPPSPPGIQMTAVGEAFGMGTTFKEAFQQALHAAGLRLLRPDIEAEAHQPSIDEHIRSLETPSIHRYAQIGAALRKGAACELVAEATGIHAWFIHQLQELIQLGQQLADAQDKRLDAALLKQAKADGIPDESLLDLCRLAENDIIRRKTAQAIAPRDKRVGTADGSSRYLTYRGRHAQPGNRGKTVLLLGSGPSRFGQSHEFDYACSHAVLALRQQGYTTVGIDCTATSALPDIADRCYFGPLNRETIETVYRREQSLGLIAQFGGMGALQQLPALKQTGVVCLGSSAETIHTVCNRHRFRQAIRGLGIPQPQAACVQKARDAVQLARQWGYPLIAKPVGLPEAPMALLHNAEGLQRYLMDCGDGCLPRPLLLERFLEYAIETEADVLSDGNEACVAAVIEHVELAGVHAADAAGVVPPISTPPRHIDTMCTYATKIAQKLNIVGLLNITFAVYRDTVYVLQAFPAASRSLPMISKLLDHDLPAAAIELIMGNSLAAMDVPAVSSRFYGVKEAAFAFSAFPEADPLLGPEIQSTGLVMGLADTFGLAFYKSQTAAGLPLPLKGTVLMTVTDEDKPSILEPARLFRELGFAILATRGTRRFLEQHGIQAGQIRKLGYGRPDIVDAIKNGDIQLVVNTPSGQQSHQEDAYIRKTALRFAVPDMTTPAAAIAAARAIAVRRTQPASPRALNDYYRNRRQAGRQ